MSFANSIKEVASLPSPVEAQSAEGRAREMATRVMDMSRTMPHLVEVFNRTVTALSAYELEHKRQTKREFDAEKVAEAANEAAYKAVIKTQFDYSAANKPRLFSTRQSPLLGPIMMFKQYPQHMFMLFAKAMYDWTTGERKKIIEMDDATLQANNLDYAFYRRTLDEKKAKERLIRDTKRVAGGHLLHTIGAAQLIVGSVGAIPQLVMPVTGLIANTIGALFGDDDEDWTTEFAIRKFYFSMFPKDAAEILAYGLPRAISLDVHRRMGYHNLLTGGNFGVDDRDALEKGLFAAAGPMGSILRNMHGGVLDIKEGDTLGGLSKILPKGLSDPLNAYKLATRGLVDTAGNVIKSPRQLDFGDIFWETLGFESDRISETKAARNEWITRDTRIRKRGSTLMEQYRRANTASERRRIMQKINVYNKMYSDYAITNDRLRDNAASMQETAEVMRKTGGLYARKKQLRRALKTAEDYNLE